MSYHDKNIQSSNSVSYINDGSSNKDSRPPTPKIYLTDGGLSNNDPKSPTPEVYLTDDRSFSQVTTFPASNEFPFSDAVLDSGDREPRQAFAEFGRAEDYIELNIYNTNDDLITHIRDFRDFSLSPKGTTNPQTGLSNEVIFNPSKTLEDLNFNVINYLNKKFENQYI